MDKKKNLILAAPHLAGSQFPNQGLNLCPYSGNTAALTTGLPEIPLKEEYSPTADREDI